MPAPAPLGRGDSLEARCEWAVIAVDALEREQHRL